MRCQVAPVQALRFVNISTNQEILGMKIFTGPRAEQDLQIVALTALLIVSLIVAQIVFAVTIENIFYEELTEIFCLIAYHCSSTIDSIQKDALVSSSFLCHIQGLINLCHDLFQAKVRNRRDLNQADGNG